MRALIFVYGTLKRGCSNHRQLAGQIFVGEARTTPGYRLYRATAYPGIVRATDASAGIEGEVWSVDAARLRILDEFEGVAEGVYHRETITLEPPFADQQVEAYVYGRSISGRPELGSAWTEPETQ
jgi:gamma-glutamylaminecyclotransferase